MNKKLVIGSLDKVDFPDLNLFDIPCKIDTGAETSAIHCHKVKLIERQGKEIITFYLLDPDHPQYNGIEFSSENFREKRIKSSFGHTEYRYVIKSRIRLFGKIIKVDLTLSDREQMKYPVLLGKKLLKNKFLVDVSQKNLSYNLKNINKG
ncbi:ATP-dependent zinc protease family protein [Chondrinema litorale]|uniref:ATP-dependent zinc protease family protein n=1 Tax=Chondrinema litorale TaxID=2994555 RepID=UPI0025429BA2|nr:RimK/LysX family protein [Chondrinema litorale]UZR98684.1 RimK/LysX family protein [Chondrinema litorale]